MSAPMRFPDRGFRKIKVGEKSVIVKDLKVEKPGDVIISMVDSNDVVVAQSNPLRVVAGAELLPYWADLHGQSELSLIHI